MFLTQLCHGQQTIKEIDADLQLITFKGGMIVKKANELYKLEIQDYDNKFKFVYIKLDSGELEKLKPYKTNVYKKDISKTFNINNFRNLKFSYVEDEYENYFFLFNDFLLANFTNRKEDERYYLSLNDVSPFVVIEINKLKFLYYFDSQTYIIPTIEGIKILEINNHGYDIVFKTEKHKASAAEISRCSEQIYTQDNFIEVEPTNQKCQLKNQYGTIEIAKKYDSIFLKKAIICYSKNRIDLYNYQYKKINNKPTRSFQLYDNCVQFIEGNQCVIRGYDGLDETPKRFEALPQIYEPDGTAAYTYNLTKEADGFHLFLGWNKEKEIKLINTETIDSLFFANNQSDEYYGNFGNWIYCPVYYKLKNGNFGIGNLEQFTNKEYVDNDGYYTNYQDLQSVKGFWNSSFKFKLKRNNLFMYYPRQKVFRYKILEDFSGYFARFELPNGQKGWLDRENKEYLDE